MRPGNPSHVQVGGARRGVTNAIPSLSLMPDIRHRLTQTWYSARLILSTLLVACCLAFAAIWQWPAALGGAGLGMMSLLDTWFRVRSERFTNPAASLLIDAIAAFVGAILLRVPVAAAALPFAYLIAASLVLVRARVAAALVVIDTIGYAAVVNDWVHLGPPGSSVRQAVVGVLGGGVFAMAFIVTIALLIVATNRESLARGNQVRAEHAMARLSAALLDTSSLDRLSDVLGPLCTELGLGAIFVERNVTDVNLGLCSQFDAASVGGTPLRPPLRAEAVAWALMPEAWAAMEDGSSFRSTPAPHRASHLPHGGAGAAEVALPINLTGTWFGTVAFIKGRTGLSMELEEPALRTVAQLLGSHFGRALAQERLEATIADLDRQRRHQFALAECSRSLLTSTREGAVEDAIRALLDATNAEYVYVDVNYEDPEQGLCARVIHDAEKPGDLGWEAADWYSGPLSNFPTSYAALARGEPAIVTTSQLTGDERTLYEEEGVKTELSIPINVHGHWTGTIAFANYSNERLWSFNEVRTLRTAAEMIGAFWERREGRDRLEKMVESLNSRLIYEEALSRCSRALLMPASDADVDAALGALLDATKAHRVFLDVNENSLELGLCARVTHEVVRRGFEHSVRREIWVDPATGERRHAVWAYDQLPRMRDQLAQGRPAVVDTATLTGPERAAYESDSCKTELNIPIFVSGRWHGSIGFADYVSARAWHQDEITMLQTAAEMIGAYWERSISRARLEELVRSKDDFVASVSHELRTPLTTVVGLAEELRRRGEDFQEEERAAFIELIAEQSAEVADLVDDLLVAARTSTGSLVISPGTVDVADELAAALRTAPLGEGRTVIVSGGCSNAWSDPGRVRQILRNLLTNADRYGGSRVAVTMADRHPWVAIAIADDGAGIDPGQDEAIFEPYARAHNVPSQPASVGLGLSVSRSLAVAMGGDLVHERRNGWTVFELTLPAARDVTLSSHG
jgi:signal transduction histidine kinase